MMVHQSQLGRSVKEVLRLTQAFRFSDLTGHITPSRWVMGGDIIPTDYTKKCEFYLRRYGAGKPKEAAAAKIGNPVYNANPIQRSNLGFSFKF